jgi:hypothetical protein
MTFFTPAVLCYGPHPMTRGDRFDLRYRIVARRAAWTAAALADAFATFTEDGGRRDAVGHGHESPGANR